MSSSQPFVQSSPVSTNSLTGRRSKSRFTYKQLHQLSLSSPTCPLRVIAHVDLDAFYAQCEQVRLGLPAETPLAVQQWQGLIAINYPARAFGLTRHITALEAQKLCPDIVLQHVATWKEGEERWAYHADAFRHMDTHKVSLDPYRMESRKILATIKGCLPAHSQKVEKASIDEVFLDLSAQVHATLLERYPELRGPPPRDDPLELLPPPPVAHLQWDTDALVDLDENETEEGDPDWDDIAMLVGSEIVRGVRAKVYETLKYTCSAGVAKNKMLAKLGSAHKKPNQQTVIRNRAVQRFMEGFKFTKIRNLGGKLGDEVVDTFGTEMVKELLEVPLDKLQKLGDDTGSWIYSIIRGEDNSEVNSRTQIKSMLSAKSFRPPINTFERGVRWLRIFAADIFSRCVEEGVLENKRKPKTINIHHRSGMQSRSKQAPIPQGKTLSEEMLFDLAKNLLAQIVVAGGAWPCANLSMSVGGFEDGITGNKEIGGFLLRGDEAKALLESERRKTDAGSDDSGPSSKRRKTEGGRIKNFFFYRQESSRDENGDTPKGLSGREDSRDESGIESEPAPLEVQKGANQDETLGQSIYPDLPPPSAQPESPSQLNSIPPAPAVIEEARKQSEEPTLPPTFTCSRCSAQLPIAEEVEHADWHFARDLAKELHAQERQSNQECRPPASAAAAAAAATAAAAVPTPKPAGRGRGRPPGSLNKPKGTADKGQMKLAFGKR